MYTISDLDSERADRQKEAESPSTVLTSNFVQCAVIAD